MMSNELPDLTNERDTDLIVMTDYKFCIKEYVESYSRIYDKVEQGQVQTVLNELINVKWTGSQESYDRNEWMSTDSDKLLPAGIFKNLNRSKLIETIAQQMEKKKMEQVNPNYYHRSGDDDEQVIGGDNHDMNDEEEESEEENEEMY